MVSSVYWEWELLLQAVKIGIKMTFIYDGIRMIRLLVPHKNIFVSIEDLFFWMYATTVIFQFQLQQSDGVLRGFSVLGMLLGMFLYNKLLGERLLSLAEKGICFLKMQLTKIGKMFKINLCKRTNVFAKNRSKHGKKKNSGKKKETEYSGDAVSNDGRISNACSSSRE